MSGLSIKATKDWKKIFEDLLNEFSKNDDVGKTKKIFDNLKSSINSAADSFTNFVNVFDKVKKVRISAQSVFRRLEGQVREMRKWRENMMDLREKLGQENPLFQKLLKEGPAKAGEIAAVNRLTDAQLQEYEKLFGEKMGMGMEASVIQQAGMAGLTNRQVEINITGNNIMDTMDLDIIINRITKELKLAGVK